MASIDIFYQLINTNINPNSDPILAPPKSQHDIFCIVLRLKPQHGGRHEISQILGHAWVAQY
jgi:hypothetical protein